MGKMMIYLVVGMGIIGSFSLLQLNQSNLNARDNASDNYEIAQARNLAIGGLEYAIMQLAVDSSWSTGFAPNSVSKGTLRVNVQKTNARYPGGPADADVESGRLVTAVATVLNETVTIRAVVDLRTLETTPPALDYAMMSEDNFTLTGNLIIEDYNNPSLNADIHTNKLMEVTGTSNLVEGHGTFTGSIESTPIDNADNVFKPNVDNGMPPYYESPRVELPEIDPSLWAGLATRSFFSNTKMSGGAILGTKENPEIVYVEGNLELTGNVEGYGVFLVTGDLILKGNTTVTALDPSGHNLAIIVGGKVRTLGDVDVTANILSQGDFIGSGNVTVTGSIASNGEINVNGDVNVKYHPAMTPITSKIWVGDPQRPLVLSRYE